MTHEIRHEPLFAGSLLNAWVDRVHSDNTSGGIVRKYTFPLW